MLHIRLYTKWERFLTTTKKIVDGFLMKAQSLKKSILKNFYSGKENRLYYLIDNNGKVNQSQEGLGISFAVMFGILNHRQAARLISNVHVSKYGITSIYPDFSRFSPQKPGRHNNIIWPMVNGFFAHAAIDAGQEKVFVHELNGLTDLALDSDKGNNQFWEIYNPYTGVPDGGWQVGHHWNSCHMQTWSATAYLNMVDYGILGIRFSPNEMSFSPCLSPDIHSVELKKVNYRNTVLNITVKGKGHHIKSFKVNGKEAKKHAVSGTGQKIKNIEIILN